MFADCCEHTRPAIAAVSDDFLYGVLIRGEERLAAIFISRTATLRFALHLPQEAVQVTAIHGVHGFNLRLRQSQDHLCLRQQAGSCPRSIEAGRLVTATPSIRLVRTQGIFDRRIGSSDSGQHCGLHRQQRIDWHPDAAVHHPCDGVLSFYSILAVGAVAVPVNSSIPARAPGRRNPNQRPGKLMRVDDGATK